MSHFVSGSDKIARVILHTAVQRVNLDITVEGEVRAVDDEDPLEVGEGQVVDGGDVEQGGGVPAQGGYLHLAP